VVGELWVRLGKIKCAAKALARVSACSSFNFAKCWHFVFHFYLKILSLHGRPTITHNGLRVGDVALCCPEASGRQGNSACTLLGVVFNYI